MFLVEIAHRWESLSVGVIGTTIFLNTSAIIPETNIATLSLVETGGTGILRTHNGKPVERPTAQASARAWSYVDARALLKTAWNALGGADGLHNITLDGVFYLSIVPRQSFIDIGLDAKGRARVAFNIDAEKEES